MGRRNARRHKEIEAERATLRELPQRRTADYEERRVYVTRTGRCQGKYFLNCDASHRSLNLAAFPRHPKCQFPSGVV